MGAGILPPLSREGLYKLIRVFVLEAVDMHEYFAISKIVLTKILSCVYTTSSCASSSELRNEIKLSYLPQLPYLPK